jgi:hypothetical protein
VLHFRINCRVSTRKKPYCWLQTRAVARWLHDHFLVTWANYAGLPDSPFYERCQKYLPKDPGVIFTSGIKGGREAGRRFIKALAPDYQARSVCSDGWEATRQAWRRLFPTIPHAARYQHTGTFLVRFVLRCMI